MARNKKTEKLSNKIAKVGRVLRRHYHVFTNRDCDSVPLKQFKTLKVDDFQEPLTLTPPGHTEQYLGVTSN